MSSINNWYGENNINWGKSYSESWWGNVNELNSWGILYPATAEGSIIYADTTLFTADMTGYTADIGNDSVVVSNDTPGTVTNTTWNYMVYVTERFTDIRFYANLNYGGNTYPGFTYNLSDFTVANGIDPSAAATRSMRIDTNSIDVGTFIADANGVLVDSADNHSVSIFFFPPYAAFSTPVYMKIALTANDFLSNPYTSYPIYKLEQVNGYVQVTQKIIS
jgi:hypothetical protein